MSIFNMPSRLSSLGLICEVRLSSIIRDLLLIHQRVKLLVRFSRRGRGVQTWDLSVLFNFLIYKPWTTRLLLPPPL